MLPAGLSRSSPSARQFGLDLVEARPDGAEAALTHSVGGTLRVVRISRRRPSAPSSSRILWLSGDCDTPSGAAARVKLRSRATLPTAGVASALH
jgi:hypothetical protein